MSGLSENIRFTKTPHYIHELMPELNGGEFMVLSFISRKTHGFHKGVDKISLSQFENHTGLARNTIIKALRSLREKRIIKRDENTLPHSYSINVPNNISTKPHDEPTNSYGSKNEPQEVQKVNQGGVQKLNPQKKLKKEKERNTTNSSSDLDDDVSDIIAYWNKVFNGTIDHSQTKTVKHIQQALNRFSVEKLKEAIANRSRSSYYRQEKPQLLNKPSAFFPYIETISNDLLRKAEGIYTYDEKNERIFQGLNKDEDFEMMPELKDRKGNPKWKVKL